MARSPLIRSLLFVVTALMLAPAPAHAQASIAGVVKDASGAVLPGVTVEASSPALIEKVRTATTDGTGQYRIVDLRPGTYAVTFVLTGFATVRREGFELSGAATVTINGDLRVGGVAETITVSGVTPLVDIQNVQQQKVLGKDLMDALPTGRTMINVGVLIPGMVLSQTFSGEAQDVGGNTGEVQQTLSIHGSRGGDMRRMVDGLSMQSQGTSVSAFAPNGVMVQEVAVDTAAGSAEQSAGGVRMNIIRARAATSSPARSSWGPRATAFRRITSTRRLSAAGSSRRAPSKATGRSIPVLAGRSCGIDCGSSSPDGGPR